MSAINNARKNFAELGRALVRSFQKDVQEKPVSCFFHIFGWGFTLGAACYYRAIKSQLPAD